MSTPTLLLQLAVVVEGRHKRLLRRAVAADDLVEEDLRREVRRTPPVARQADRLMARLGEIMVRMPARLEDPGDASQGCADMADPVTQVMGLTTPAVMEVMMRTSRMQWKALILASSR